MRCAPRAGETGQAEGARTPHGGTAGTKLLVRALGQWVLGSVTGTFSATWQGVSVDRICIGGQGRATELRLKPQQDVPQVLGKRIERGAGGVLLNSGPLTAGQSFWDDGGLGERREPRSICASIRWVMQEGTEAREGDVDGRSPGAMGCSPARTNRSPKCTQVQVCSSMIFNRDFYLNKTRDSVWRRMKLGKP